MNVGDRVTVARTADSWLNGALWWPESDITGTVERICKNGTIRIACDQFYNTSSDNRLSKYFAPGEVTITVI